MARYGKKLRRLSLLYGLVLLLIVGLYLSAQCFCLRSFGEATEPLVNPYMGFVANADYDLLAEKTSLVYVNLTFREVEPQEGVFAWEDIRERFLLDRWKAEGKRVVLRFVCDIPGAEAHLDIPDWLYEKTGDGTLYDCSYGKGYAPNYENPVLIEAHEKAILALGSEFGLDDFVAYVEVGSIGHWGEWHVNFEEGIPRLPSEEVCRGYVDPYVEAFPYATLLMRRTFSEVSQYGMGVYNDMAGDPEETHAWLSQLETGGEYKEPAKPHPLTSFPEIWKKQPVGGEFTSGRSMEEMLQTDLAKTLQLLEESHMTFIGPMIPELAEQALYQEGVDEVLKRIGYRIGVRRAIVAENPISGVDYVWLTIDNKGTAPLYAEWEPYLYLVDTHGGVFDKYPVALNLVELMGGQEQKLSMAIGGDLFKDKKYRLGFGIENPDNEAERLSLNMDGEQTGNIYYLTR